MCETVRERNEEISGSQSVVRVPANMDAGLFTLHQNLFVMLDKHILSIFNFQPNISNFGTLSQTFSSFYKLSYILDFLFLFLTHSTHYLA